MIKKRKKRTIVIALEHVVRQTTRPAFRTLHQDPFFLSILQARDKLFWIKFHAYRVMDERFGFHEFSSLVCIFEVVDLRLKLVAVMVAVVNRRSGSMVHRLQRHDALRFALPIRQ